MPLDLTFKQVCDFIKRDKRDDSELIDAADKLLALAIICTPIVFGPVALPALSLLTTKNELIKIGKSVFKSLTKRKEDELLARHERMHVGYCLICYTAFFEALDQLLPSEIRSAIALLPREKEYLAKQASETHPKDDPSGEDCLPVAADASVSFPISFPHPAETIDDQKARLVILYRKMSSGFFEFIKKLSFWEEADAKTQTNLQQRLKPLPERACEYFEAQYWELARKYEDFGIWANLREHKQTREQLKTLSAYVIQHAQLVKDAQANIDIGFQSLQKLVLSVPEQLEIKQATDIAQGLRRYYEARIDDPILEDKYEPDDDTLRLLFPRIRDAFIPQSYLVLRQTTKARRLEDEKTWEGLERNEDLGPFLLRYLISPYSIETPLIVLGHPGSGKSLLTKVLSAKLLSKNFMPVRVPLREVDSGAAIVNQIEEQITKITGRRIDSWANLSGQFLNNPPVVILDGYDELLQASGKVFSGYLKEVRNFQKNEAEQGRPVRAIVTSRITLIDKATIPEGSTVLRLLDFDQRQRNNWIAIWNEANKRYFADANVDPFELPGEKDSDTHNLLSLAEQPLLLLMLALYDSEENKLRRSKTLDRTVLYDSLLRRFVQRERSKRKGFDDLSSKDQDEAIDRDMQRLGVAAIGMYNRRQLHILSSQLDQDLKFFELERQITVEDGRPLSQADMLLGSFFFVHKSKSVQKKEGAAQYDESVAFEFLHNTFGEFLAADFILRQTLGETESLAEMQRSERLRSELQRKLREADGFSRAWFACLVHAPLYSRPVVLEMLREWMEHLLKARGRSQQEFLNHLDEIVLNQVRRVVGGRAMPSLIQRMDATPFGNYPLLGHLAIYSVNLIILRTILSSGGFLFNEQLIEPHEDGTRPWDQLTHIWRSWFSLDNLNALTAILRARRQGHEIQITPKEVFRVSASQDRLETLLNVGAAIADNVTAGMAGLLSHTVTKENWMALDEIESLLQAESIDLSLPIKIRRLQVSVEQNQAQRDPTFLEEATELFYLALKESKFEELNVIVATIHRGVVGAIFPAQTLERFFQRVLSPRLMIELVERRPDSAALLMQLAHITGAVGWLGRFGEEWFERLFHSRHPMTDIERNPVFIIEIIRLARLSGVGRWLWRLEGEWFQRLLHPQLVKRRPDVALEAVRLAREIGSGHMIEQLDDKWFERLLGPHNLRELVDTDPDMAVELIRLAREVGSMRWRSRIGEEWLERFLSPKMFIELLERRLDLAIELLRLASDVDARHWFERMDITRSLERVFQTGHILELIEHRPDMATELIRLSRKAGVGRQFRQIGDELLDRLLRSRRVVDSFEWNFEFVVELMLLAQDNGDDKWFDRFSGMRPERLFHPRRIMELSERRPELAAAFLRLAREGGGTRHFSKELLKFLPGSEVLVALRHALVVSMELMLIAREARATSWLAEFSKSCVEAADSSSDRNSMLQSIPLEYLPDLYWLASATQNQRLSAMLDSITRRPDAS